MTLFAFSDRVAARHRRVHGHRAARFESRADVRARLQARPLVRVVERPGLTCVWRVGQDGLYCRWARG